MSKILFLVDSGRRDKSFSGLLLLQNKYDLIGLDDDAYPERSKLWGLPVVIINIGDIVDRHADVDDFCHLGLSASTARQTLLCR